MDLSADIASIIISKLQPSSLKSLKLSSKNLLNIVDTVLADDYNYKIMTEELLGMMLPDYLDIKWKSVYKYYLRHNLRGGIYVGLSASNPKIVRLALDVGTYPNKETGVALNTQVSRGNVEAVKLLLERGSIDPATVNRVASHSPVSGSIETIDLLLNDPRIQLELELASEMIASSLRVGNLGVFQYLMDSFNLDLSDLDNQIMVSLRAPIPDIVLHLLDNNVDIDDRQLVSTLHRIPISKPMWNALIDHPRTREILLDNIDEVLMLLFELERTQAAYKLLQLYDVSSHEYRLLFSDNSAGKKDMVLAILSKIDVQLDMETSFNLLSKVTSINILRILLDSSVINVDLEELGEYFYDKGLYSSYEVVEDYRSRDYITD